MILFTKMSPEAWQQIVQHPWIAASVVIILMILAFMLKR